MVAEPSPVRVENPAVPDPSSGGDPTIGVAFGGGGARGYAHIHVIEILDELGVRPNVISGSSIGAIMGAGMASGMSGRDIREYVLSLAGNRAQVLARLWATRPKAFNQMVGRGFWLSQFNIEKIVESFLPAEVPKTFEELQIPTAITGTDYYGHKQCFFEEGDLCSAIAASAALPAIFKPVRRDGRIYIDGGIFNPVPYDYLLGKSDIIVGIDVVGVPDGDTSTLPGTIDSLYGASQLMMQSIIQSRLAIRAPDVFVQPPVGHIRVMEFLKAKQILSDAEPAREDFKRKLDAAITAWHRERPARGGN